MKSVSNGSEPPGPIRFGFLFRIVFILNQFEIVRSKRSNKLKRERKIFLQWSLRQVMLHTCCIHLVSYRNVV